jgi:hypothetical protein
MKTLSTIITWCFLVVCNYANKQEDVDWRLLGAADLREHVSSIKNYRHMSDVLGEPDGQSNMGQWTAYTYKLPGNHILSLLLDLENVLHDDAELRAVRSINLLKRGVESLEPVWTLFIGPNDQDHKFRSDHIDIPTKTNR